MLTDSFLEEEEKKLFKSNNLKNPGCRSHPPFRSSHQRCSIKIGVLKNFAKLTEKHLWQSLFFSKVAGLRPATLFKKRLWQVLSCEFYEIFKNTYFEENLRTAASVHDQSQRGFLEGTRDVLSTQSNIYDGTWKTGKGQKLLTIFSESSTINVWRSPKFLEDFHKFFIFLIFYESLLGLTII